MPGVHPLHPLHLLQGGRGSFLPLLLLGSWWQGEGRVEPGGHGAGGGGEVGGPRRVKLVQGVVTAFSLRGLTGQAGG